MTIKIYQCYMLYMYEIETLIINKNVDKRSYLGYPFKGNFLGYGLPTSLYRNFAVSHLQVRYWIVHNLQRKYLPLQNLATFYIILVGWGGR